VTEIQAEPGKSMLHNPRFPEQIFRLQSKLKLPTSVLDGCYTEVVEHAW
jgi:hypothetical protein